MITVGLLIAGAIMALAIHLRAKPVPANQLDIDRLLFCISMREGWQGRDGPSGEKGNYQLTNAVWRRWSQMEFTDENVTLFEREVAECQIDWIRARLKNAGYPETAFYVALIWTAGWTAFDRNTYSAAKAKYAREVQNLYLSYQ